jgi:RNA polymerase sigma-70 factor (ECF subfamily)
MQLEEKQKLVKQWIEAYTSKLLKWARTKSGDDELAKDLVQDTFIVAFESYEKFKGQSTVLTWLYGILNNKLKDHYTRSKKVLIQPLLAEKFTEDMFEENGHWKAGALDISWHENTEILDNPAFLKVFKLCLSNLPQQWQDALLQKFITDTDAKEICQDLGISITNYWQIIHRAKLMMRACLGKNWKE